jgi:hypothetical protein
MPVAERALALKRHFAEHPILVVLDNLDGEVAKLHWIESLNDLANPSRFILTSRKLPHPTGLVYVMTVGELSSANSLRVITSHVKARGLKSKVVDLRANWNSIFDRVGGHPLALKLFGGLLHSLSLAETMDAIGKPKGGDVAALYTQIYRASWRTLGEDAQRVLLTMPLAGEAGLTLDQLQYMAKLEKFRVRLAVENLVQNSLLEMRGFEPRYGIHHLTRTFLSTELLAL